MKSSETEDGEAFDLRVTHRELLILRGALREVCHGFKFPDFEARMGVTKDEARSLLNEVPKPSVAKVDAQGPGPSTQ